MSSSISFLPDRPGWAFDAITKLFAEQLTVSGIRTARHFQGAMPSVFQEEFVFVCWWPDVDEVARRISQEQKILCRIADIVTWTRQAPTEWQRRFSEIRAKVFAFIAASSEIATMLMALGISNLVLIGDPVDVGEFTPATSFGIERPRLGWCGNPAALQWLGFNDLKGFSVFQSLQRRNDLSTCVACRLSRDKMPDWYHNIDVYVCTSKAEGTPLPLLEAMASGRLVITTRVGIVPEISSAGLFVFDGTARGLDSVLKEVVHKRQDWEWLGRANREFVVKHRAAPIMASRLCHFMWRWTARSCGGRYAKGRPPNT